MHRAWQAHRSWLALIATIGVLCTSAAAEPAQQTSVQGSSSTCADADCDFMRRVLGSTEEIWAGEFSAGRLPRYGAALPPAYIDPTLVVFTEMAETGCGLKYGATGPFYCYTDGKLYIDPHIYYQMLTVFDAPGDFAQAFVIAHEVGHRVEDLIGARNAGPQESANRHQVRLELEADCFAGVWANRAQQRLSIDDGDIAEGLNAVDNFGDDRLGVRDPEQYQHGTGAQRMRWFTRGFDTGDARQCDTMRVAYDSL